MTIPRFKHGEIIRFGSQDNDLMRIISWQDERYTGMLVDGGFDTALDTRVELAGSDDEALWHSPEMKAARSLSHRQQNSNLPFGQLMHANALRLDKFLGEDGNDSCADWMVAMVGEVGEAANIMKKIRRGDFTLEQAKQQLADELGDIQIHLDIVAQMCEINLARATKQKFNADSKKRGLDIYL